MPFIIFLGIPCSFSLYLTKFSQSSNNNLISLTCFELIFFRWQKTYKKQDEEPNQKIMSITLNVWCVINCCFNLSILFTSSSSQKKRHKMWKLYNIQCGQTFFSLYPKFARSTKHILLNWLSILFEDLLNCGE